MAQFYDGTKLLSFKDLNKSTPEIYICTSNRSAGKTVYFTKMLINRFLRKGDKFIILYRYKYEIKNANDKFFSAVKTLFFPDYFMNMKMCGSGVYAELFLTKDPEEKEGNSCGYAIAINTSDCIKKFSNLLSDAKSMFFDEFMTETMCYCNDEVNKFISIHNSLARGNGSMSRYLPVYMISNPVDLCNPYYLALGIAERLDPKTKFLRGNGWVLEQGYNADASAALRASTFNKAFENEYTAYQSTASYMTANKNFIEKPTGNSVYLCTLYYKEHVLGVYKYMDYYYISLNSNTQNVNKIACSADVFDIDKTSVGEYKVVINLSKLFSQGKLRFQNEIVKSVFFAILKSRI